MKLNPHFRLASVATLLTIMAATPGLRAATYPQTVLNAGPAAYWRFESVNDVSLTNSFTNTFLGDATVTAPDGGVPLSGVAGNHALLLDGNGDIVRTGVTNQLTFASNGTFMAWVNFSQLPSVAGRPVEFILKSHFTSPLDFLMDENNRLLGYAGDYTPVYYDFNPALATNTWYHLAFTFDNVAKFKRLYVNGVLVGDLPLNPNLIGSTDEIAIGNSTVFTDRCVNGRIDEVALFNRALTSAEIQTIFASGGVTTPAPLPVVRVNIEITREINALERGLNEYYGLALNFSIIPAPFSSTNKLFSPNTNFFLRIGGPNGGVFDGSGSLYLTLGEALQAATNGLWTLILNQGAVSEQTYYFTLTATNLTTNDYAIINLTSPVDGSVGNPANVAFTWTQSRAWPSNHLDLDGPTFARATVPSGATNWTNAPTLNFGKHDFNLYLRTNAAQWVGITTPTNSASQTLPDWDGGVQLNSRRGIRFRVGQFTLKEPGLQAHLRFDNSNSLGFDSSGQTNDAHEVSFGTPPFFEMNGLAGGAANFSGSGWFEFERSFSSVLGGDFTVAVWIKTTQTVGANDGQAYEGPGIVWGDIGGFGNDAIPLALNGTKAAFMTGNPDETLHSTNDVTTGQWVHLAVTRTLGSGEKKIYVNGVLDSTGQGYTNLINDVDILSVGYGNVVFNGLMDDLQIYSLVLPASAIAFLSSNPGQEVTNFTSLGDAVNAPALPWTTFGDASWFVETTNTHDNLSAAQSGAIGNNQETWIQTIVTGPGTLSFWWKVSSQDGSDYLQFLIDGNFQDELTGDSGWQQRTYQIGSGTHTNRWHYYKDGSNTDGQDAGFLDEVSFGVITNTPPVITVNPFSQTNYPGYNVALLVDASGTPTPTWQWYKVSSGLISGATNKLFIPANSGSASVGGSYFAIASNSFGSTTTLTAVVTFVTATLPPDWSRAFTPQLYHDSSQRTTNSGIACLLDSAGNLYSANSFNGTNTFGSGTFISGSNKFGTILMKQTSTGTAIWGRGITNSGSGNSYPQGLVPAPGDGVYMSGVFAGTNWLGTNQLVETAGASVYLARFDSSGSNLWVRTFGGTNAVFQARHELVSDPAGNVTISALINNTTSFGTTNVTVTGQKGALVQYDADGNLRWVQVPSGWFQYLTYSAGRIYGSMSGNETNYAGGLTNLSDRQWSLVALNATNGQAVWLRGIASALNSSTIADNPEVAVSGTNVFVVGTGAGSNAVFGPFSVSWPVAIGQYFARYDTNGTAQLATTFGSATTLPFTAIADASGNVYVGGDFDTYSIFGNKIIAAPFYETIQQGIPGQGFVAKFDRNGNPLWARLAQSQSSYLNTRDLALASDGVWACGFFNDVAHFGTNTVFGTYTCIGTPVCSSEYHASGVLAKITEGAAPLPVTLLNPLRSGGSFTFQFQSQSGFTHFVESRTNVALGPWIPRATVAGNGSLKTVFIQATNSTADFFRVRTQ